MAWYANLSSGGSKTSGNTLTVGTVGINASIGNSNAVMFIYVVADNITANTPTVSSITQNTATSCPGETATWQKVASHTSSSASSGTGVVGELWAIQTTVDWTGGGFITVTLSANVTARAAVGEVHYAGPSITPSVTNSATSTTGVPSAAAAANSGDLVIGCAGWEASGTPVLDADTTNGTWAPTVATGNTWSGVSGGSSTTNVTCLMSYKYPTASGTQTYNPTMTSTDSGAIIAVFPQVTIPTAPTSAPTVSAGNDQVTVTAPALSGGANTYNVYRGTTKIASGVAGGGTAVDTAASASATQTYTVRGVNIAGEGPDSPTSSAVAANPGAPTMSATPGDNRATLNLAAKNYDAVFKIYRGLSGGARSLVQTSSTVTAGTVYSWTDTGVVDGTAYDYTATTSVSTPTARTSAESSIVTVTPNRWNRLADLPANRVDTAVGVYNTNVYVAGGLDETFATKSDVYLYTSSTNSWSTLTSLPAAVDGPAGVVYGNYFYVIGGVSSQAVYRLDCTTNTTWTTISSLPFQGSSYMLAEVVGSKIWAMGGGSSTGVAVYDPANTGLGWVSKTSPSSQLQIDAYGVVGTKIYILSGGAGLVSIYDTATDTWSTGASPPVSPSYPTGRVVGGKLLMVSGNVNTVWSSNTYSYDPTANSWSLVDSSAPIQWTSARSVALDSSTLLIVGGNQSTASNNPGPRAYTFAPPASTGSNFTGSVALSGSGTLSPTGVPTLIGSSAFSGSGSLALTGKPILAGSLSPTGSGTLTGTGVPSLQQSLPLTGSGTLALTGVVCGTVALSGSGSLSSTGTPSISGTDALAGSGALTGTGVPALVGSTGLAGAGTLATTASNPKAIASQALSGSGTLALSGTPATSGTTALSGSGALTSTALVGFSGTQTYTGSGTLAGTGKPALVVSLGLSGDSSLAFASAGTGSGDVTLSGAGTLAGTGKPSTSGGLGATGSGSLSTTAVPSTTGQTGLSGSGTLALSGTPTVLASTGFTGTGTVGLSGSPSMSGSRGFTGSGALTAAGSPQLAVSLGFTGAGALTSTGSPQMAVTVLLSGSGTSAASGVPQLTDTLFFSGVGTSTDSGQPSWADTLVLASDGTLTVVGGDAVSSDSSLTGSGVLTLQGQMTILATWDKLGGSGLELASAAQRNITIVAFTQPTSNWATPVPYLRELVGANPSSPLTSTDTASLWTTADPILGSLTGAAPDNEWSGEIPDTRWEVSLPDL